jgi:carbon storage regulator CsrA
MLVLERGRTETIMIGDNISVTVTDVNLLTGRVKLGFTAPEDIIIDREEVYYRRKSGWTLPKHLNEDDMRCLQKHNTTLSNSNATP